MSTHGYSHAHLSTPYFPPPPTSSTQEPSNNHGHERGSESSFLHNKLHVPAFSLGEDVDLAIGLTASALAGNELLQAAGSKEDPTEHLFKAGLSVVAAVAAFKMMKREHEGRRHHLCEHEHPQEQKYAHQQEQGCAHQRGRVNSREGGTMRSRSGHDELSYRNMARHDSHVVMRGGEKRRGENEDHKMDQWSRSFREGRERADETEDKHRPRPDERKSSVDGNPLRQEDDSRSRLPSPSPYVRRHSPR